jgi:hypothetical protein
MVGIVKKKIEAVQALLDSPPSLDNIHASHEWAADVRRLHVELSILYGQLSIEKAKFEISSMDDKKYSSLKTAHLREEYIVSNFEGSALLISLKIMVEKILPQISPETNTFISSLKKGN